MITLKEENRGLINHLTGQPSTSITKAMHAKKVLMCKGKNTVKTILICTPNFDMTEYTYLCCCGCVFHLYTSYGF